MLLSSRLHACAAALMFAIAVPSTAAGAEGGDLAAANQQFANPLASATLWITENNAFVFSGDAVGDNRVQNALILDPLIPQSIGDSGWSLVHRPILPIWASIDTFENGGLESNQGIGDFTYFAAFSPPAKPLGDGSSAFIWGAGPIVRFPTGGSERGAEKYSAGAMAVGVYSSKNFTFGALNQNLFSFAGEGDRDSVQQSTLQYFYFYNFTPKWGIGAAPTISYDWEDSGAAAIPIGIGLTRSFFTGKTPNRLLFEIDYYVSQDDDFGPEWNFRVAWGRFLPRFFD